MVKRISSLSRRKQLKVVPSSPNIPLDLLINNVCTKLPVKTLIRFKIVCKQWFRALSEPEFISLHRKTVKEKPHNQKILCGPIKLNTSLYLKIKNWRESKSPLDYQVFCYPLNKFVACDGVFYCIDLQSSSSCDEAAVRLPGFPLHQTPYHISIIIGYSNGMVCAEVRDKNYTSFLFFGNPSTGVYKILPKRITGNLFCCFFYDSLSDDYKFVRIFKNKTRIFHLKSDSWQTISNSPSDIDHKGIISFGFFHDGLIYWLFRTTGRAIKIVWFNLQDEQFGEQILSSMQLLSADFNANMVSMKVVGDSICIINTSLELERRKEFVMWSMINEGGNVKFVKLMNVRLPFPIKVILLIEPFYFKSNGEVLFYLEDEDHLNFYFSVNPKTARIEEFTLPGLQKNWLLKYKFASHISGYIQTLVSPYQ